jgi:PiT family inorganic phosphate transporter
LLHCNSIPLGQEIATADDRRLAMTKLTMSDQLIIAIALALIFGFLNGVRDVSNIVATMISSRAFSPRTALNIASISEFIGPFLFGVVVAQTIAGQVVESEELTLDVIMAALAGAIAWNLITWYFGLPGSSTHALIGGLVGATWVGAGLDAILWGGVGKVLIALFAFPLIGFICGFLFTRLIYFLARNATPRINDFFKSAQFFTAVGLGLSHGANDAQKTMGISVLSLVIGGVLPSFAVPTWVVVSSAGVMALGASLGGWRMIRTLGGKFYKIRPLDSFSTQLTSTVVVLGASLLGAPVSTSHIVSSAIIGVGSSERMSKVRWSVTEEIAVSWLITIPASALLSAGVYWLIELIAK